MAGKDGDEPGEPSAFDRMSLNSLKRELEVQKAQTANARDEARERLEAEAAKQRAFPWRTLAIVVAGGVVVFFGLVYLLRASFPEVASMALPDWVYTPVDAGPRPSRPDAGPRVLAAPDAGARAGGHHGGHGHGTGTGAGTGTESGTETGGHGLDLGSTDPTGDPIEGL